MTPSHAYYHYTIAREREVFCVGPPGTVITLSVTHNPVLGICATPPRAVALRPSIPGDHLSLGRCSVSGRRESNPVLTNPNRMYYRHTPARHRTPLGWS